MFPRYSAGFPGAFHILSTIHPQRRTAADSPFQPAVMWQKNIFESGQFWQLQRPTLRRNRLARDRVIRFSRLPKKRSSCGFERILDLNRNLSAFKINVLSFSCEFSRKIALQIEIKPISSQSPKRKRNHFGIAGGQRALCKALRQAGEGPVIGPKV